MQLWSNLLSQRGPCSRNCLHGGPSWFCRTSHGSGDEEQLELDFLNMHVSWSFNPITLPLSLSSGCPPPHQFLHKCPPGQEHHFRTLPHQDRLVPPLFDLHLHLLEPQTRLLSSGTCLDMGGGFCSSAPPPGRGPVKFTHITLSVGFLVHQAQSCCSVGFYRPCDLGPHF